MATTSPDNLYSPDSSDPYALTQDLGAMQDSVQTALVRRANAYVGTSAQRNAFTTAPVGTIWSDTNGSRLVYKRGASSWEPISPARPKCIAGYATAVAVANELTRTRVDFPVGFFTAPPTVVVTANSQVIGSNVLGVSALDTSASGFDIGLRRTNSVNTGVHWIAMERGEVT